MVEGCWGWSLTRRLPDSGRFEVQERLRGPIPEIVAVSLPRTMSIDDIELQLFLRAGEWAANTTSDG